MAGFLFRRRNAGMNGGRSHSDVISGFWATFKLLNNLVKLDYGE